MRITGQQQTRTNSKTDGHTTQNTSNIHRCKTYRYRYK